MPEPKNEEPIGEKKEQDPREEARTIGEEIKGKTAVLRMFITDFSKAVTKAEDVADILILSADNGSIYANWENILATGTMYTRFFKRFG